jgi:hypothetical protein
MPILAYAVSLAYLFLDAPTEGIDGATVHEIEDRGLRAWFSEVEEDTFSGAEHVTRAALGFHHFVSAVFREGTALPFRFPTILESIEELRDHLEDKFIWYSEALRKCEGLVQYEARVRNKNKLPPEAASGKEYLEVRKRLKQQNDAVVKTILGGFFAFAREHQVRETPQGTRVYLLIERGRIPEFREAAAKLEIPGGFEIRLTGPWPPTEFLPPPEEEG